MARILPELGQTKVNELERAWHEHTQVWERERLMVLKLVVQHKLSVEQIGESDPLSRHLIIQDQAGFHLKNTDPRVPASHN